MDSSERLLRLVALLLDARHPLAGDAIFEALPDEYAGTAAARERKLSRDRAQLEAIGIPISHVTGDDDNPGGYAIDRASFYMPKISLTPDERAVLFAVGSAALGSAFPLRSELAHALTKLRAVHGDGEERAWPVILGPRKSVSPYEDILARAVADRRRLRLRYQLSAEDRVVDPYAFSSMRGRFAMVGYCHSRKAIRTFYADRIAQCIVDSAKAKGPEFDVPADFEPAPHLPTRPWQIREHPPLLVELEFPPGLAESGPASLGVVPGSPVPATNLDGLLAEILAFGQGVHVRGPAEARTRMREMLQGLKARLT